MRERLPPDEWLGAAKSLSIGQKRRINHGCGSTAACDVFNQAECWSAYCHRCHLPGWVPKEHQQLRSLVQEDPTRVSPVPADALHLSQTSTFLQRRIWDLLIQKGCPPGVIPEEFVWYSQSTNRILLRQGLRALGRALSAAQQPKWMAYGNWTSQPRLFWTRFRDAGPMVLVEDALSAFKVAKAVEVYAPTSSFSVVATLGTVVTSASLKYVQGRDVLCMYDPDKAGRDGLAGLRKRLNVFGGVVIDAIPKQGDPKDNTLENLYGLITAAAGRI